MSINFREMFMRKYTDFTDQEIELIESLGFNNALPILERVQQHREDKTHCVFCGEEFSDKNVFTDAGWRETKISGVCETCWNKSFGE